MKMIITCNPTLDFWHRQWLEQVKEHKFKIFTPKWFVDYGKTDKKEPDDSRQ